MPVFHFGLLALGMSLAVAATLRIVRIAWNTREAPHSSTTNARALGARRLALPISKNPLISSAVIIASAAFSWIAAGTKPFTFGSDLVCTIAFAPMAGLALSKFKSMRRSGEQGKESLEKARPKEVLEPWILAVGLVIFWELVTYFAGFGGLRHEFPTLSVIDNYVSSFKASKAAIFFLWLALGWSLFKP